MKKNCLLIIVFCSQYFVNSQYHEIGAIVGGANYIGDVGSSNYVFQKILPLDLYTSGIELHVILFELILFLALLKKVTTTLVILQGF